ncbi:hypothetical protein PsorP6_016885 [Peronosclerospora sorghi]|uniref:Uncharacterized protein n=1 Tax=Peronosclerospora sorghi TaxID=230839 RepID=A0ACC0WCU0_9STRA|nr:hypothetical protein PsorP6_016885 [Peronosclerospora sorghi]
MSEKLSLPDAPTLRLRQLHQDLVAFVGLSMTEDEAPQFMSELVAAAPDLVDPLALAPPKAAERAALQANTVSVCGKHVDVSPLIQQEICTLSDEFRASEKTCLEVWLVASDAKQREGVERADQLPPRTIADSVKSAARYFLTSEMEYKLHLLKELLRLRLETGVEKERAQFLVAFTNKLITDGLVTKLVHAFETHLVQLAQVHRMEQSVSYWHTLVAECLVYIVASTLMLAEEVQALAEVFQTLSARLKTVVTKVSPHIVNFSSFAQLFQGGSLAGTSPEGAVRQVACMLQTITALQVALFVVLLETNRKMHRETGDLETGSALCRRQDASVVKELHRIFYEDEWEQKTFQSVAMLGWAGFLARNGETTNSSSNVTFAETDAMLRVVRKAVEERAFTTLVEVELKYLPDKKRDLQLYKIYHATFELLFRIYSSKMMIDVPTMADKAALAAMQTDSDEEVAWTGDCLENIIDFTTALCAHSPKFCGSFWRAEQLDNSTGCDSGDELRQTEAYCTSVDGGTCHDFLIACRDAVLKNPACLAAYLRLVSSAASGTECAQQAFHHVKQNPQQLSWDHFFAVMAKYQRLLTEAEKPAGFSPLLPVGVTQGVGIDGSAFNTMSNAGKPGPRFIRPKELEALETIQQLIQEVIAQPQLALIFFHNHNWSPIPMFVAFLQCRIPSSLKGSIMKTLAAFARVPDIAPYVWRQVDALQILRTTGDTSIYGNQDICYELEHYESLSRTYPATRGFVTLLYELFENPHVWKSFEGDGRVAAIQYYFEFLLEHVFLKFDLRKYEHEEEKWALVNGSLAIFKKILRHTDTSTSEGSLSYQIMARFLSSSPLLNKVLSILSGDGGVENIENTSTDMHLEHAFFYCLDIVKRETEAKHGSLNFVIDVSKKPSHSYLTKTTAVAMLREQCVQHALEIVLLVLEKDVQFVNTDLNRQLSHRLQVEMLHTILCRHRADFVNIVKYIKYSKSVRIPHLSVVIMRRISARMSGADLVNVLVDSGASADIMIGYMNRLLNVYDDAESDGDLEEVDNQSSESDMTSSSRNLQGREPFEPSLVASCSIRVAILDLMLENLDKSAPNLAHLLLGSVNQHGDAEASAAPASYMKTGLAALLSLVSMAEFGLATPELAERCYHILHLLMTQEFSSSNTVQALESSSTDFFVAQIQLFGRKNYITKRSPAAATIATLNMRGWFFKLLALYLHLCVQKEPPHMKKVNKLMAQLLAAPSTEDRAIDQMLLIQLLDQCSFHLSPPSLPTNQHVVALAEQVTEAVAGCYYKWLKINIERFCTALQTLQLTASGEFYSLSSKKFRLNGEGGRSSPHSPEAAADRFIEWAVQWNIYSERIAAESHALNSLRELLEVIVLDYLSSPLSSDVDDMEMPALWKGLHPIASMEVRQQLMSRIVVAVLSKLTDTASTSAQLFEIVAKMALILFAQLRETRDPTQPLVGQENRRVLALLFRTIGCSAAATGNISAARNARALLYVCVIHVLHVSPNSLLHAGAAAAPVGLIDVGGTHEQLVQQLVTPPVVELMCQDARDGNDTLSMALAVSVLESLLALEHELSLLAIFRERGYLLHLIEIFQQLCDLDAKVLDTTPGTASMVQRTVLPQGVDATTIGILYECFLSLFIRVAETQAGAVALLESGLIRVLSDAKNIPSHRPLSPPPQQSAPSISLPAFQRIEALYIRKWLPVIRFLCACCASLPSNRALTTQVLSVVHKHWKLITGALKVCASRASSQPLTLNVLHEVSYVTFLVRYVSQCPDLCAQTLVAAKWAKLAHLVLHVFLYFSTDLVPRSDDKASNGHSWWQLQDDHRPAGMSSFSCRECGETLVDHVDGATIHSSGSAKLLDLSVQDEAKLYASRMIVCNAIAFCTTHMLSIVTDKSPTGPQTPLLSCSTSEHEKQREFPSMSMKTSRDFAVATEPFWTFAPSVKDFSDRLQLVVGMLETSKEVETAVNAVNKEATTSRPHTCPITALKHVLEYHVDSLTFLAENMLVVLLVHFMQYLAHPAMATSTVRDTIGYVLAIVHDMEVRPGFVERLFKMNLSLTLVCACTDYDV